MLLQHIAHLLPDGFLNSIERAYRPQFDPLPIDETLDVRPLPDEPFATHLLHEAHHIGVIGEVRHSIALKESYVLLVATA